MDGKAIIIPKINIRIKTAAIVASVVICATLFSLYNDVGSGKTYEGNISKILHTTVENGFVGFNDSVDEQVDSYYKNLSTNSVYDTVEIIKGCTIRFAQGSTVIITDGKMRAVCKNGHLIDITEGIDLANSEEADRNHLYVIQNEEYGLYASEDSNVLIKGGYEINNGNKE